MYWQHSAIVYKSGSLIEYAAEILNARGPGDFKQPLDPRKAKILKKACKNIRIMVTHRGEKKPRYKIYSLSELPASQLTFANQDGQEKKVTAYFHEHYNLRLQFPNM